MRKSVLAAAMALALGHGAQAQEKLAEPRRLPDGPPNILIVLIDDVGPGLPDSYGGEVHTPTLSRVAAGGISYNRFHSAAIGSATRAALLTGRNGRRGSGVIPKSSATLAEVLKDHGYDTAAFGKWSSTPASETSAAGPFDHWPTSYGFSYFYGFLADEASQYQPGLVRNTTLVLPPKTPAQGYHLSEDLADDAIAWLRRHRASAPDRPFLVYWATGAAHGPHQVPHPWADKYKSKFDDGWDAYRERVFERAKKTRWIPAGTRLTPRPATLAAWDAIPESEKPFQRRLMEVFAGFAEHADANAGRVVDEIERLGYADDTLVFYLWGDNGSSAEGQLGTISDMLARNGIASRPEHHIGALQRMGGLDLLGGPKVESMYHAGWAWAGSTPYRGMKPLASHFGGTRQPMAVAWPKRIRPDPTPRSQFHHVSDLAPTIYELLGIPQDPIDGVSLAYTFDDAKAGGRKHTQFFEVMGSRAIYHDGWMASAIGPSEPWELYQVDEDWSQADDLAAKQPDKLRELKKLFLSEFERNRDIPIGVSTPKTEWSFPGDTTRLSEAIAPRVGTLDNTVTIRADLPARASGVLYALGGIGGGVTCYLEGGTLSYEYNIFEIQRIKIRAKQPLAAGKHTIEVETQLGSSKPRAPAKVRLSVDGKLVASGVVAITAPVAFSAQETFDVGTDLGSPVSLDYFDRAPFAFDGKIERVEVRYSPPPSH